MSLSPLMFFGWLTCQLPWGVKSLLQRENCGGFNGRSDPATLGAADLRKHATERLAEVGGPKFGKRGIQKIFYVASWKKRAQNGGLLGRGMKYYTGFQ